MPSSALVLVGFLMLLLVLPVSAEEGAPADPVEQALASPQATGLLVTLVVEGSQAAELGIVPGDILVSYGGTTVPSIDALRGAIQSASTEVIPLAVVRIDGAEKTFTLKPGSIGVQLAPVEKGKGLEPLPPATDVKFDFSSLAELPHDDWYQFSIRGKRAGFDHGLNRLEDGKLVMRREVAFDGGAEFGVNHFDVTVVLTAETAPQMVSFSFYNPITGYSGEGVRAKAVEGHAILRYTHTAHIGGPTTVEHPLPGDLPAIPTYVVETLACFMPREKGACFHYRPITDGSGEIGRPSALVVHGEEEVQIGDATLKAVKVQIHAFGGAPSSAFWVNEVGRVVKADYTRAVSTAAAKEDCLKDLHHGIQPRTAD